MAGTDYGGDAHTNTLRPFTHTINREGFDTVGPVRRLNQTHPFAIGLDLSLRTKLAGSQTSHVVGESKAGTGLALGYGCR